MAAQPDPQHAPIETLDRAECLALLATAQIGRVASAVYGGARIEVVNFLWDGASAVIRMGVGAKSAAIGSGSHLALEVDRLDEATASGWDVTIAGPTTWVTDPAEIARLDGALHCWAPGERPHFARIHPAHVFGRRVRAHTPIAAAQALR